MTFSRVAGSTVKPHQHKDLLGPHFILQNLDNKEKGTTVHGHQYIDCSINNIKKKKIKKNDTEKFIHKNIYKYINK